MKRLLTTISICLFFLNYSMGEEVYRDVVNDTYVSFDQATKVIETTSFDQKIRINYFVLNGSNWEGESQFNSELTRLSELFLTSEKVHDNFMSHFNSTLDFLISDHRKVSSNRDSLFQLRKSYEVDVEWTNCSIISLCNDIAIVSFELVFSSSSKKENNKFSNLIYEEIRYFDLHTGLEVDPSNWINKRMKNQFMEAVKNSVASNFNRPISKDHIREGLPFFNGAGFYFQLQGNSNIESEGIPTIQVRFSLSEIQPYLNTSGLFSAYVDRMESPNLHNKSFQEISKNRYRDMYWYLGKESYALGILSLARNFNVPKGIKSSRYFLTKGSDSRHVVLENHYDTNGRISCQKTYHEFVSPILIEDSIIFEYWPNGNFKSICFYESHPSDVFDMERSQMLLIKSFSYDQYGNLSLEKSYDWWVQDCLDCIFELVVYYTYLSDRIIQEYATKTHLEFGSLIGGAVQYTNVHGYMAHSWSSEMVPNTQVLTVLSENRRLYKFSSKGVAIYDLEVELKDGRIKSGKFDFKEKLKTQYYRSRFTIDFNQFGNIVSYEGVSTYQDHEEPYITEVEYNENQVPQKFISKGSIAAQTKIYEIEYY